MRPQRAKSVLMLVPKTTMHKDHFSSTTKHDVRITGKIVRMKPIPIAEGVQQFSDSQFGSSIALLICFHYGCNSG